MNLEQARNIAFAPISGAKLEWQFLQDQPAPLNLVLFVVAVLSLESGDVL